MSCRRLEDDDLLAGLGEALDDHVEQCPECSARAQGYRRIVGWIADGRTPYRPPADWQRKALAHALAAGEPLRSIPVDAPGDPATGRSDPSTDRSAVSPGATAPGPAGPGAQAAAPRRRPASRAVWPTASAAIVVGGWIAWAALRSEPARPGVAVKIDARLTGESGVAPGGGSVAAPGAPAPLDHDSRSAGTESVESVAQPDSPGGTERSTKRGGAVIVDWPPEVTSAPVILRFDPPSGSSGGLTIEDIQRVVDARMAAFHACYQNELRRAPGIHGTLLVRLQIGGGGQVQAVDTAAPGSTLHSDAVAQCVTSQVKHLRFPAKGSIALVSYPFEFTQ